MQLLPMKFVADMDSANGDELHVLKPTYQSLLIAANASHPGSGDRCEVDTAKRHAR